MTKTLLVVHVDIIQAVFPCLLRVDVVNLSPGQELLISLSLSLSLFISPINMVAIDRETYIQDSR